jgi:2-oxoglutarate dehydrogenase E1 component
MNDYSYINNAHPEYIDQLYKQYLEDPASVEQSWRTFFQGFQYGQDVNGAETIAEGAETIKTSKALKELAVINLINSYRTRGHLFTKTNPVRTRRAYKPSLDLENFSLSDKDLDTVFEAGAELGLGAVTLREILDHLNETYCKSIGAEYMFIRIPKKQNWLKKRMESTRNRSNFNVDEKRRILLKLNQAVVFEKFLHTKYVGQKRFSLQGGETIIPGLDAIIEYGAELGLEEILIGTAHRGRLNILANTLNKRYEDIFEEFEGEEHADAVFSGDVKYHLGYMGIIKTQSGKRVKVGMAPNPSHLEVANPVVAGMVKAKLDNDYAGSEDKIAPIMIHGDAAIAGQGVVYELIQMSLLDGYRTGGTIHIVINNQIGFTTNYLQARSSTYCTDVAKVTLSPVFHVNADDVEAVVTTVKMALEYRQKFHTDVFIDLLGYRRYGHNEGDEPRFTQPQLYSVIAKHPDPREIYNKKLLESGSVERGLAREMEKEFKSTLQDKLEYVRSEENGHEEEKMGIEFSSDWTPGELHNRYYPVPDTSFPEKRLREIGKNIFSLPANFKMIDKVRKLYQERLEKLNSGKDLDWASAEFLAYASILDESYPIRLSGQDSERGTFSHRHAVLRDEETEELYLPLNHVSDEQATCRIFNSLLSEYGEMGFEYGYANATPHGLIIWEAQFGDFVNGAQIVIDQFLSSSESKWHRTNGLVLYLPHGYEGQGPEHSNARVERFLQLSANNNWRISIPSTPASFYHLLRTQVKYPFDTPLIIFTPKSLLRHPDCTSNLRELYDGSFQTVIDDNDTDIKNVKRVLFCTGKIYYDLKKYKDENKRKDVAIVRIELLYPFPEKEIGEILKKYKQVKEYYWIQEEPENYGCWLFYKNWFKINSLKGVYRKAGSAPATGFHKLHAEEQQEIVEKAFNKTEGK